MPNRLHGHWDGFERLEVDGKAKAKCDKCCKCFANTSSEFLIRHKIICGPVKSKRISDTSPSTNTPSRSPTIEQNLTSIDLEDEDESICSPPKITRVCKTVARNPPKETAEARPKQHIKLDSSLLVMFARLNWDIALISSPAVTQFLTVVDASYQPPCQDEFLSSTVKDAYDNVIGAKHKLGAVHIMGALTAQLRNVFYAIAFLIKNDRYFYIHSETLNYSSNTNDEMESFLKEAIKVSYEKHSATIKYLLIQSDIIVGDIISVDIVYEEKPEKKKKTITVHLLPSFKLTIDSLKHKINASYEDYHKYAELICKVETNISVKLPMSEAVNEMMYLFHESISSEDIHQLIEEEMKYFLTPISLIANFMDHRFMGKEYLFLEKYGELMFSTLYDLIPDDCITPLRLYKKKKDPFSKPKYADSATRFSSSKFWKLVQS